MRLSKYHASACTFPTHRTCLKERIPSIFTASGWSGKLTASNFEFGLSLLVDFGQADHEDAVLLARFGDVYIHFFGQKNGEGERAPVELTLEIAILFHLLLVRACAGNGEHLAGQRNIYRGRL